MHRPAPTPGQASENHREKHESPALSQEPGPVLATAAAGAPRCTFPSLASPHARHRVSVQDGSDGAPDTAVVDAWRVPAATRYVV